MSGSWHGGKGSTPRPMSVTQEEYENRWDAIFGRDLKEEPNLKNEYQDILSTEDCILSAFEKFQKQGD
jgi:hypothetical protein